MKTQIFNIRIRLLPTLIMIFTLNGISLPLEGAGGGLFAQDPQLFEHTWYLKKVVLDDDEYYTPSNWEVSNVPFNISVSHMETSVCGGIISKNIEFDEGNDFFTVDYFIILTLDCLDEENQIFENRYYSFFLESQDYTYYYEITTNGDTKSLVLTNENGDEAHYGDEPLSVEGFTNTTFSIYPNPVSEVLYIQSSDTNLTNLNIKVYDINGSLVLSQAMETSLNVKELKSGLYFLSIENKEGYRQVLKFVKK